MRLLITAIPMPQAVQAIRVILFFPHGKALQLTANIYRVSKSVSIIKHRLNTLINMEHLFKNALFFESSVSALLEYIKRKRKFS